MGRTRWTREAGARLWRRLSWKLILAASLGAVGAGRAKAAAADDAAQVKLTEGTQAFRAGLYDVALEEFAAAAAFRPSPRIEFNVAETLLALKREAEAADAFEAFLADGPSEPANYRDEARQQLAAISARTVAVVLSCATPAHAVQVDGQKRTLPRPRDHLRVGAGPHQITVSRDGGAPLLDEHVDGARGERLTLSLCVPPPPPAAVVLTDQKPAVAPSGADRSWWTRPRIAVAVGLLVVVVGVAVLAVAASQSGPPASSLGNYPL